MEATVISQAVRDTWLPATGKRVVLLRWLLTEWCNYRCEYCPQDHGRYADKGNGQTAHCFDNYPVDAWKEAFDRHFGDCRLSLTITGGEPMIDRKNMTELLNWLSAKESVECIRIDTNAWWKASQFPDLDRSKIVLMCTFHPTQTTEEKFIPRMAEYQAAGFTIGMVNYVLNNADALAQYRRRRALFSEMGLILHPNPLHVGGVYSDGDRELMMETLPRLDYEMRSQERLSLGVPCLFPSLSYEMDGQGRIHVGCHTEQGGSFFDATLPVLPEPEILCPWGACVCLDKYSFMAGVERNVSTNPLAVYAGLLKDKERERVG